ncbi:hypothetical protein [Blastococcus montanus]|uniref:hypothetical protein n=1 Tax=Blastococcus montanus TaxID=3144973 RepID=UPI003208A159
MVRSGPSVADAALIATLAQHHDVVVSPEQLERWRAFGLLPRAQITFPGNGGSVASLPEGTLDQALFLARRVRRGKPWQLVALEAAQAGCWLSDRAAHDALIWVAERYREEYLRRAPTITAVVKEALAGEESGSLHDLLIAVADAVAHMTLREAGAATGLRTFVQRADPRLVGEELDSEVHDTYVAFLQAVAGNELSPENRQKALRASGISEPEDGGIDPFSPLRLLGDPVALQRFAGHIATGEALFGCWLTGRLVQHEPVMNAQGFGLLALVNVYANRRRKLWTSAGPAEAIDLVEGIRRGLDPRALVDVLLVPDSTA